MHDRELLFVGRLAMGMAFVVVSYAVVMGVGLWDGHPVTAVTQGVVWAGLSVLMWLAGRRLCRKV